MRSLEEIRQDLKACLPDLQSCYGVTYLGIFGSYVRGEQKTTFDWSSDQESKEKPSGFSVGE